VFDGPEWNVLHFASRGFGQVIHVFGVGRHLLQSAINNAGQFARAVVLSLLGHGKFAERVYDVLVGLAELHQREFGLSVQVGLLRLLLGVHLVQVVFRLLVHVTLLTLDCVQGLHRVKQPRLEVHHVLIRGAALGGGGRDGTVQVVAVGSTVLDRVDVIALVLQFLLDAGLHQLDCLPTHVDFSGGFVLQKL